MIERRGIKTFYIDKDPASELTYYVDWSRWLAEGDTIDDSVWIVPDGIDGDDEALDSPLTSIKLSGGAARNAYELINRITTATGEVEEAHIYVTMKHSF